MNKCIFLAGLIFLYACTSDKNTLSIQKGNEFLMHLNILDTAAKLNPRDTVPYCSETIGFMVENTDVKICAEGTRYRFLFFTKSELGQWHKYYNNCILKKK